MLSREFFDIFFLVSTLFFVEGSELCPKEIVNDCECFEAFGKAFVKCEKLDDGELREALTKLSGRELKMLTVTDSELTYLPSKLLSAVKISKIQISKTAMFYLSDDNLKGKLAETLSELRLDNVTFSEGLDWGVLEELNQMKALSVTFSELEEVTAVMSFVELEVDNLDLSDNDIELVHEKAFSRFKSLKNLILKNNLIDKFQRSMLPYPVSEIQFLDLSNNKLSSFPEDAFVGMPKFHSLLLDGNKFSSLQETYLGKVWNNLVWFSVRGNPLICDCNISWMLEKSKPIHLRGECGSPTTAKGKDLQNIEREDLAKCFFG